MIDIGWIDRYRELPSNALMSVRFIDFDRSDQNLP